MKIIESVKSAYQEAFEAGQRGEFFDDAWKASRTRERLSRPAKTPMAAIERRDRALYVFEEGLRDGHDNAPIESAWARSYSLVIAKDMAERAELAKQ